MIRFFLILFALFSLFCPVSAAAQAEETGIQQVRILAAVDAMGEEPELMAAVEWVLAENWHTYWRDPGESGMAPRLDWQGSENVKNVELLYPAPVRKIEAGIETFAYDGRVSFPLRITPERAGEAINLQLRFDILVCKEICIPAGETLRLRVPAGSLRPSADAALVKAAFDSLPKMGGDDLLRISQIEPVMDFSDPQLVSALLIHVQAQPPLASADVFIEHDPPLASSAPKIERQENGVALLRVPLRQPASLLGHPLRLTLVDGERAIEQIVNVEADALAAKANPASDPISLWLVLGMALLGGLILNLMPCVLPVLSLKVLGVLGHGGAATPLVRLSFIASSLGILFSFLLLAVLVIGLKEAGQVVGWGIQFQNPYFLTLLISVLTLFAGNLFGFFEVPLPRFILDRLGAAHHPARAKLAGDFMTGMLATLLATPCTAPFLGTAVGFAVVAPAPIVLLVFLFMGIGLALPFLLFAAFPQLATRLPRPGAWMQKVRIILALALLLTALWLISVLAAHWSLWALCVLAGLMLLALLFLLLAARQNNKAGPYFMAAAILCLVLGCFMPLLPVALKAKAASSPMVEGAWQDFQPERIADEVRNGRVVFLDITADWCLTCQANKKLVLLQPEVMAQLFNQPNVVPMMADWTLPNDRIAAYLQSHQRAGIPFNIVFGPKAPQGIILPELLTTETVLAALARAGGQ